MLAKVKREGVVRRGSAFFCGSFRRICFALAGIATFFKTFFLAKSAKIAKKAEFGKGNMFTLAESAAHARKTRLHKNTPFLAIFALFAREMLFARLTTC